MKPQPPEWVQCWNGTNDDETEHYFCERDEDDDFMGHYPSYENGLKCPYGAPGDRLWVKEAWCEIGGVVFYKANYEDRQASEYVWMNPMFMPRRLSRITLEVTGLQCERLQRISAADAIAEGYESIGRYIDDWNKLNAKRGYGWDANPWVWVVEFKMREGGSQ